MTLNSRSKGHGFERRVAKLFQKLGFKCTTSRFSSKEQDNLGVDLCGLPINVQCKAVEKLSPSYHEIIMKMPNNAPNVIFHKRNRLGVVVVLDEEFFLELFKIYINASQS